MNKLNDTQAWEAEVDKLKHVAEIQERDEEIVRLQRRIADLEDFLRGASVQFQGMAGRR
jgi:t-SNARE complex subunit (syntaxin)